jgi:Flp pilus assembly protein TadD
VLLSALLATKTKEISFTLPLAVLLYEVSFFGARARRLVPLVPLLAIASLIPLALLGAGGSVGQALSDTDAATRVQTEMGRLDYLRTEAAVVVTYLRLLILPVGQNLDYDYPVFRSLEPRVLASAALLAGLAAVAALLYRWTSPAPGRKALDPAARLAGFGLAWFFLTLLVESSLVPIVDVINEHRVYLPSAGIFAAAAAGAGLVARRASADAWQRVLVLCTLLVSLLLASATLQRNAVWADELSLWADAAAKSPGKFRPHLNLGRALALAGRPGEAAVELRRAVAIDPGSAWGRTQLGAALLSLGRPAEAEPELREALRLSPSDPEASFDLAVALSAQGRKDEARGWFRRFLEVAPPGYEAARRYAEARAGP